MRKLRSIVAFFALLGVLSVFAVPQTAGAAYDVFDAACSSSTTKAESPTCASRTATNPLTGPNGMLMTIAFVISLIAGFTALIVIMLSGAKYIMAGGDAQKATAARNTLIGAVIGLVIIVSASLIITFVVSRMN